MPVFCVRHNQRRRDNGDQRSNRFRPRYDVLGERAAGRAFPGHDDEVSRNHCLNLYIYSFVKSTSLESTKLYTHI